MLFASTGTAPWGQKWPMRSSQKKTSIPKHSKLLSLAAAIIVLCNTVLVSNWILKEKFIANQKSQKSFFCYVPVIRMVFYLNLGTKVTRIDTFGGIEISAKSTLLSTVRSDVWSPMVTIPRSAMLGNAWQFSVMLHNTWQCPGMLCWALLEIP